MPERNGMEGGGSKPSPASPTIMSVQALAKTAAEADRLRREIDQLRSKLLSMSTEVSHWRMLALDHGLISERDYQDLISRTF